jgi:hypothetical protein
MLKAALLLYCLAGLSFRASTSTIEVVQKTAVSSGFNSRSFQFAGQSGCSTRRCDPSEKQPNNSMLAEILKSVRGRMFSHSFYPNHSARVEMNKVLETIRGSWITRDHEIAGANREYLRTVLDQIPADLREKFLNVLDWAERTERWSDIIIHGACKDSDLRMNEIIFLESQMKIVIQAIRVTKDVDSIRALRATTRETIERMEERKREEDQKRLQEESAALVLPGTSPAV